MQAAHCVALRHELNEWNHSPLTDADKVAKTELEPLLLALRSLAPELRMRTRSSDSGVVSETKS